MSESGSGSGSDDGRLADLQSLTDAKLTSLDLDNLLEELLARVRDILSVDTSAVLLFERGAVQRLSDLEPPQGLVIGPEGGFTPDEVAAAERAGMPIAGLGARILRSETVAVAAAAVVLSRTGDFA